MASAISTSRPVVQSLGGTPYLMRSGEARVAIRVSGREYAVHALETDGTRRRAVPCATDGGWLRFSCQVAHDARQATFLYEVERTDR